MGRKQPLACTISPLASPWQLKEGGMASIFLSYARADLHVARRIAEALEAAGHSVWWDRHISAGSRFSKEIDAALKAADLIVVLWSRSSIESDWVQDEAAFGRDRGRLLPVLIDSVEPPLGFRQLQAMALGRSARKQDMLHAAIAAKLGEPVAVARPRAGSRFDRPAQLRWSLVAATVIAVLVGLSLLLLRDRTGGPAHMVAVTAAEGGDQSRSQELARTIATDLGRYRAGQLGSLTVLSGDRAKAGNADYRVEVGVSGSAADLAADISLLSPNNSQILWTATVQGSANRMVDLRQQAVAKLGDVLTCAVDVASESRKLGTDVLSLYLNGCGRKSDINMAVPDQELLSVFRQVTAKAPQFAPAWANLALIQVQSFPGTPPPDRPALLEELTANLAKAKQLDPTLPETIAAVAYFHPNDGTKPAHALGVIERGLKSHPDSALLYNMRALFLSDVGRQNEAVMAAQRAVDLNPLSPTFRDAHLSTLAYSGQTDRAYRELKEAEAIWPGSTVLEQARYRLDLRYGDPRAALRALKRRGAGDLRPVPMDTAWKAFLEARIAPSRANVEKALDAFRARYRRDPGDVPGYLQALGTFNRVEEAYDAVKDEVALDSIMGGTEALFRSHMRPLRADRRFIALAAKLGLLAYWERTGIWPDFCRDPQLPYDCRAEAAKLTPEQRKLARFLHD